MGEGNGLNFILVFGVINSGVTATVNSQGKRIRFSAFSYRCEKVNIKIEVNQLGVRHYDVQIF